jgi:hypothetical protein
MTVMECMSAFLSVCRIYLSVQTNPILYIRLMAVLVFWTVCFAFSDNVVTADHGSLISFHGAAVYKPGNN